MAQGPVVVVQAEHERAETRAVGQEAHPADDAVHGALGLDLGHRSRPRAVDDAHATARVFIRLLEHLEESGVRDLDGARRFKRPKAEVNTRATESVETQPATTEI